MIWLVALSRGLVCAVLGVAGQAGRWSERYDLINHITPLILLSSLAAIGLSLALGRGCARWLGVTIGAVADLTAGLQIVPVLARSALQSLDAVRIAKDAPRLKLIQLSVFHANPDPHATVDWLLSQNADVIVLEESKGLDPKSRARLVAAYPQRSDYGDLILSRLLVRSSGRFDHRPSPTSMFILGGFAEIEGSGGSFTVVGVHFTWPQPVRFQMCQRREFARYVATLPTVPALVPIDHLFVGSA